MKQIARCPTAALGVALVVLLVLFFAQRLLVEYWPR